MERSGEKVDERKEGEEKRDEAMGEEGEVDFVEVELG